MRGEERRAKIKKRLSETSTPIPGVSLAKEFNVSRLVIVQDIALLRANGLDIVSTNRGYFVQGETAKVERVFKVLHTNEEVEEELNLFVDAGAWVKDVFVYHKVYGVVHADMNLHSRMDVKKYMKTLEGGKSTLLMNITSGFHYHTVVAESTEILDAIQEELTEKGFLAKLQDYEPVDFWKDATYE